MWKRIKALKCFISNLKVEVNIFPFMSRLVFVLFPVMYVFDVIAVVFFISFEWCLIQMMLPGLPSEHESCVPTGGVAVSRFIYVCWLCHLVVTAFPFPCSLSELIQAPVWLIDSHERSADVVNQNEYLATSIAHTHTQGTKYKRLHPKATSYDWLGRLVHTPVPVQEHRSETPARESLPSAHTSCTQRFTLLQTLLDIRLDQVGTLAGWRISFLYNMI